MPLPRWLNLCRSGTRLCADGACCVIVWTLWLVLVLALGVQLFVATVRELPVPGFVLRELEQRLATAGTRATFGAATFDPAGHVLIRDLRLSLEALPEPVLTAQTVFLQVEPWGLLVGHVHLKSVAVSGADLLVPALLSPSGRSEAVIRNINTLLYPEPGAREMDVAFFTARAGPINIHASGAFEAPRTTHAPASIEAWLARAAAAYPRLSREIAARLAQLPQLEEPRLDLRFEAATPARAAGLTATFHARSVETEPALTGLPVPLRIQEIRARFGLPIAPVAGQRRVTGDIACAEVDASALGQAQQLRAQFTTHLGTDEPLRPQRSAAALAATAVQAQDLEIQVPLATLTSPSWPLIEGQAKALVFNRPIEFGGELNLATQAGDIALNASLAPDWIEWADRRLEPEVKALLAWEAAPQVRATVTLAPGGRPAAATADLATRAVTARGVALDGTAARLRWSGTTLEANDIRLTAGTSEARGRYEMDTATNQFRFLLAGQLQPAAIDGWFRDWWPRFWSHFEFEAAPAADVDVRGRWREPRETSVFVAADGAPVVLRGAELERIRTRLFVRPGYTDVIEFIGDRDGRGARGSFTYAIDLATRSWTGVTFDISGDTDLGPAEPLFGPMGASIIAPFEFSTPPRLRVRGRLDGPGARDGRKADVRVEGEAAGDWAFYEFPLNGLAFRAHLRNDVLLVEEITAGFAGGVGSGRVELRGIGTEHRLGFDLALKEARLGESIRTLEAWTADRHDEPRRPVSRFQQRVAAGRLHLDLSADGYYDKPFSLTGGGNVEITGANLGEVNILGLLSTLLRRTIFNFTTLQLDTVRGSFALAGDALEFEQLRLSGPRAAIEAQGTYHLEAKDLDVMAKVLPFDASDGFLGTTVGAMLTPLSNVLEVRLSGRIDQPKWAFAYGPTNLLRTLSGQTQAPAEAASAGSPPR